MLVHCHFLKSFELLEETCHYFTLWVFQHTKKRIMRKSDEQQGKAASLLHPVLSRPTMFCCYPQRCARHVFSFFLLYLKL